MVESEIPIPPLHEQHRIVKNRRTFTDLDKGIEYLESTQQQLKIYRQAVLKWAFEGKLTNKNLVDGELPKGWKWIKLGDVVNNLDGKRIPLSRTVRATRKGKY